MPGNVEERINGEKYSDPTADLAIARADKELKQKRKKEESKKCEKKQNGSPKGSQR